MRPVVALSLTAIKYRDEDEPMEHGGLGKD